MEINSTIFGPLHYFKVSGTLFRFVYLRNKFSYLVLESLLTSRGGLRTMVKGKVNALAGSQTATV